MGIDAAGDFTLVWQSINQELNVDGEGSSWGVYARQFVVDEAAGTISSPQAQEFRVNQTVAESQRFPAIGVDAAGRFAIAWQTIGQDAASWGIFAWQYGADGLPVGSETRVNTAQTGPQILPAVAQRITGDFNIFWSGQGLDRTEGTSGQRYRFIADDFNRCNQASLGPAWTAHVGSYDIEGDMAAVRTPLAVATFDGVSLADVAVEARVTLGGPAYSYGGVVARYSGAGDRNMYWGGIKRLDGKFSAENWRIQNGGYFLLASTRLPAAVPTAAHDVRFDLAGTALRLSIDGTLVTTAQDAALPGPGSFGIRTGAGGVVREVVVEAPQSVSLPYSTSFPAQADGTLGPGWTTRIGAFSTATSAAVALAPLNLATLNTAPVADLSATAALLVDGDAEYAGFAMRYAGPGDTTMLWGGLANRGGGIAAELWANQGGIWQLLGAAAAPGDVAVPHAVRMVANGSALQLAVDGVTLLTRTTGLVTAGGVGIRGSAGASINDLAIVAGGA